MNSFPANKKFAFSIFDDTDLSTVENIAPIYRLLTELGMRTTKSVWPLASVAEGKYGGCSLQDPEYLKFVLELRDLGFEIAIHNMRNHHCSRELVEQGFAEFRRLVGSYPRVHANHSRNRENLYWGSERFKLLKPLYALGSSYSNRSFEGHLPESELFWGDLCHQYLDYMRNFVFREINLDRVNPTMPYHDPAKPLVKYWFSSSDGSEIQSFCDLLSESNQDKLEHEGGVCIVYTHFACGFAEHGSVHPRVEQLLRALARRDGWFVPVAQLLDYLRVQRQTGNIPIAEFHRMEGRWAYEKAASAFRHIRHRHQRSLGNSWLLDREAGQSSPKTRVVHITSAHSALDTRIFYKECRSLAQAGYEVILLGAHPLNESRDGVMLRGVGKSHGRVHRMTVKLIALCREAFRLDADVYHIHDPELLLVALLLRLTGKRVVYDIHEDLPRSVLYKRYIPRFLRKPVMWVVECLEDCWAGFMTGLITATPTINKRFSLMHPRTAVVNNFPLKDELTPTNISPWNDREMAVAYIGSSSEVRGIREMLSAIDLLPRSLKVRLKLAGTFSTSGLQAEMAARQEWRNVDWHGMLDRREVGALLGRVRMGLVLFHPEQNFICSQPIKFFEYMAAGIPVIASDFPLWRSIIESSGCGLLVNPLDPQAIAAAIECVMTDSGLAEQMGRRGRKAVEERFNWSAEEGTLLSFYSSMLRTEAAIPGGTLETLRGAH